MKTCARWALGVAVLLLCGCGSAGAPEVAPSSLAACGFDSPCPSGERCDISQSCGPLPDGGTACSPVSGDARCHRDCSAGQACASGERCTEVSLFDRADSADAGALCL